MISNGLMVGGAAVILGGVYLLGGLGALLVLLGVGLLCAGAVTQ